MQHRNSCARAKALREFNGPTEISEHGPYSASCAHRHFSAYAAIALRGKYTEFSADGTLEVGPGDVVVHPPFHRHANVFATSSVTVLNLILPMTVGLNLPYTRLRLAELPCSHDGIVDRPCESAAAIAEALARTSSIVQLPAIGNAVELAWHKLKEVRAPKVYHVAAEAGVSTEHLVRAFRARYGLSPGEYRAEHRFHHALQGLFAGDTAADTARSSGYSDQSHMTRDFQRRAGVTPMQLSRELRKSYLAQI